MFGRDEEENLVLKLRQADVDDAVTLASALLGGKMPMPFPLQAPHSEMLLNFSIRRASDRTSLHCTHTTCCISPYPYHTPVNYERQASITFQCT